MKRERHQSDLALARRIRGAGIPIYIGEDDGAVVSGDASKGLLVYTDGPRTETRAFDFYGTAAYVLNVVITINLPHFAISAFGLELPWESYVWWLDDPGEVDGRVAVYRFDRSYLPEFDRNLVLNHFADVERTWARGKSLRGYLLGVGNDPIPPQYQQGATIPAFLIVYDQLGKAYRSPISIWRDTTVRPRRLGWKVSRRQGGLLDKPEPGFEHLSLNKEDQLKK
jgi:hypothetical protein